MFLYFAYGFPHLVLVVTNTFHSYNSTQPAGTAAVAPSASGVGSSPGATGSPISGVNGAVGMSILSGSALSLIVAGGVALVSLPSGAPSYAPL